MSKLIDAFDSDHYFGRSAYYTICFDALPSILNLYLTVKESKANMDRVMELLDLQPMNLSLVRKKWETEDIKAPDPDKNFVYLRLYKSDEQRLVLWVELSGEELFLQFLYQADDQQVEDWALAMHRRLCSEFGEDRKPTFRVLSRSEKKFYTEEVRTADMKTMDIGQLYNDDFQEIDQIITQSMEAPSSGLILLHGRPGTGKTSYIKHLIARFPNKLFIFIQNEFVKDLLKPEFVAFMLRHKDSVLIIEDAERVVKSRELTGADTVVSTILQLTDGLFSDYLNIKILCTFNTSLDKIDQALLRKGRLIAKYDFGPLSVEKTARLTASLGFEPVYTEMALADIFRLADKTFSSNGHRSIGFK